MSAAKCRTASNFSFAKSSFSLAESLTSPTMSEDAGGDVLAFAVAEIVIDGDVMTGLQQLANDGSADVPGAAGDEGLHADNSIVAEARDKSKDSARIKTRTRIADKVLSVRFDPPFPKSVHRVNLPKSGIEAAIAMVGSRMAAALAGRWSAAWMVAAQAVATSGHAPMPVPASRAAPKAAPSSAARSSTEWS